MTAVFGRALSICTLLLNVVLCSVTAERGAEVQAVLRFPRQIHLKDDDWTEFVNEVPRLKRWEKANGSVEHDPINMEERTVLVKPANARPELNIMTSHFELVDLHPRILPLLRQIKQEGLSYSRSGPTTAGSWFLFFGGGQDETREDKLARLLQGSDSFRLSTENTWHYAFRCAGFVIRKGGPEGAKLDGKGFDMVAQRVHIDQDLQGEPLLGMKLTWVFKLPFMRLLNIWSPLHDVRLRPMAFADFRTVDRARDVVRYRANSTVNAGGRFGSFVSDRLMSLYSDEHEWYWFSNMRLGQAVAFDTSDVPHSSFTLPGEDILARIRNDLEELKSGAGDRAAICSRHEDVRSRKDLSLDMEAFIGSAEQFKRRICDGRLKSTAEIDEILEYITRASLEIRCATFVAPKVAIQQMVAFLIISFVGFVVSRLRKQRHKSSARV